MIDLNGTHLAAPSQDASSLQPTSLKQRLLAETIRIYEDAGGVLDEAQADAAAREAEGDLERRIIVRAQRLSIAPAVRTALQQLGNAFTLAFAVALALTTIAGATTARVALSAQEPVNFFWALGSILGVQTIALLLWFIFMAVNPGVMWTGSLGGLAYALGRRTDRWLHKGPIHGTAVQAVASVYTGSPLGRWTLSALSHALWLGFLCGCLLMTIVVLSIEQYSFAWETTILSERSYVALTRTLSVLPELLGFPTPNAQQIAASQWTGGNELPLAAREAWSGLLLGGIVVYGLLPRLLLLILCLALRRRAARRYRLDTGRPGFSRLQNRLLPTTMSLGTVDPDTAVAADSLEKTEQPAFIEASGAIAIIGLEIDPPEKNWPPLGGVDWLDLGLVDNREQRHRILELLRSTPKPPRMIVVVCSLTTTPDRGIRAFLSELNQVARIPLAVVLTDGQRLRARGHPEEVQQRIEDWRRLTANARVGEEWVLEVDLEHLTDASRARLKRLVGAENKPAGQPARRIEASFHLIVEHAERWSDLPEAAEQAELHRAIAALYQGSAGERPSWQALLRTGIEKGGTRLHRIDEMKISAERMIGLLPERLRKRPRWLAAGAVAGAMGCIAAAALVSPAAIAALPAWAGLGALVTAILPNRDSRSETVDNCDLSEAVNGAALFTVLLELQGRDEAIITRVIDRVAGEDDPPQLDSPAAVRAWLETLRQRFDRVLAAEALS